MAEPFVGEIKMFAGNFAPRGYALCQGQLLSIPQQDALFSLLGTMYGGDGRTTFGLPDFRGRTPIHHGTGPGLTPRNQGVKSGAEQVTLNQQNLPAHSHRLRVEADSAVELLPTNETLSNTTQRIYIDNPNLAPMGPGIVATGGNRAHENMSPFLCISFVIALSGHIYPSRQ